MRIAALVLAIVLGAGLCAALASCGSSASQLRRFEPDDRAAIRSVLERQVEAWNRGDLAGYMEGYARSPALIFTSGGNVRRGWQNAFDHYQARYATDPKAMGVLRFQIESIDPVGPVGGDGAVVLGRWELTGTAQAGRGVFSLVLERRPEGWRIIHDHTSAAL
jgi:ketosteroid isomerase-like protein